MKPRNKNEREVEQLRASLNDLDSPKRFRKSDYEWIEKNHEVGHTEYFAIYEVVGGWQVIRMFMYRSWTKRHEALHEPLRYWFKADGSYVIEAKKRQTMGNYYIDAWIWDSDKQIRANGGSRDVRDLNCNYVRVRSLIPELKRANFHANNWMVKSLKPFWLTRQLLTNNRIETLFKLNQKWLTWKFYHYDTHLLTDTMWQSIRVALRHGYHWDKAGEINDWCDMIRDLEYLGLDTRNPHYICPAFLGEAHQHWIEKANKKRTIEHLEAEKKEVLAYEPTFYENRVQFFGMVFKDKKLEIQIIPTAWGIKEEGIAMHHCVGGYYNKPNSLILSAKIDGKRIETIEVSLYDYRLVQSRGLQNKSTKYHQRIVKLIENNLSEIQRRNEEHKMKIAV